MRNVLIIYDSFFGNTEQVAQAMTAGLTHQAKVSTLRIDDVGLEQLTGLDILIVGSPTRAFSPTSAVTKFIDDLPPQTLQGIRVTAYDTRIATEDANSTLFSFLVRFFGYAAKPIADRLQKKGGVLALSPEGFLVQGKEGPLKEGELERAAMWVQQLIAT